jgi:hypothetical protein
MSEMQPHPQALFTELDDGTGVLLHLETKFYFTLNPAGVVVWKSLGEGASKAAIADRLTAEFRVERDVAERDVTAILEEMLSGGLVLQKKA